MRDCAGRFVLTLQKSGGDTNLVVRFPPRLTNNSLEDGHIPAFPAGKGRGGGNLRALEKVWRPSNASAAPGAPSSWV